MGDIEKITGTEVLSDPEGWNIEKDIITQEIGRKSLLK